MHYVSRCWRFELLFNSSNKFASCLTHTQFAVAGIMVTGTLKSSLIISLYFDLLSAWRASSQQVPIFLALTLSCKVRITESSRGLGSCPVLCIVIFFTTSGHYRDAFVTWNARESDLIHIAQPCWSASQRFVSHKPTKLVLILTGSSSMMHVRAAAMVGAVLVIYTLATIISFPSFATALILNSTSRVSPSWTTYS